MAHHPWLYFLILLLAPGVGCKRRETKSKFYDETLAKCRMDDAKFPQVVVLSSTQLGGLGGPPLTGLYAGSVPPTFVLYDNGTVVFTKAQGKAALHYCAHLTQEEKRSFVKQFELPGLYIDTFADFDPQDRDPQSGFSEIFFYKTEFECWQYQLRGTTEQARLYSRYLRASVIPKMPASLITLIDTAREYDHPNAIQLTSFKFLLELTQQSAAKGSAVWPTKEFPLQPVKLRKEERQPRKSYYTTTVPTDKMVRFHQLMRKPVIIGKKSHKVGFRFQLPMEEKWAAHYRTASAQASLCNRQNRHLNYNLLYGFHYLAER